MSNDEEKIVRYARIGVSEKTKDFPVLRFLEFPLSDVLEEERLSEAGLSLYGKPIFIDVRKYSFLRSLIKREVESSLNCVMFQLFEKKFINIDGEIFQSESKALSKIIMFGELISEGEILLTLGSDSLVYSNMKALALKQAIRLETLGGEKSIYLPFDSEKQEIQLKNDHRML